MINGIYFARLLQQPIPSILCQRKATGVLSSTKFFYFHFLGVPTHTCFASIPSSHKRKRLTLYLSSVVLKVVLAKGGRKKSNIWGGHIGKKSMICLEGRSMTACRGYTFLPCSSQQLPHLRLGHSRGV